MYLMATVLGSSTSDNHKTKDGNFPQKPREIQTFINLQVYPHLFTKKGTPVASEAQFENGWCLFGEEEKDWLVLFSMILCPFCVILDDFPE